MKNPGSRFVNWRNGGKRLGISTLAILAIGALLYYIGFEYLFSRRRILASAEVVFYVAAVNVITIVAGFALYRAYLWVVRGFGTGPEED